jgi:hypothetical protein
MTGEFMLPAAKSKPKLGIVGILSISILLPILISACSFSQKRAGSEGIEMAPLMRLPEAMQSAPASVREAYQFALANPDVLEQIPCYCGCDSIGHTSNYDCYIQGEENGQTKFAAHALGCDICVDITQETMRMLRDGKTVEEIRPAIDTNYAKFGSSTNR